MKWHLRLWKICKIFWGIYCIIIWFAIEAETLSKDPSPFSYDELLRQAQYKMDAFEYGRALDRLAIAERKVQTPDYRYYTLLGEVYFRMGREGEAMEAFYKSLELNPNQKELLLKVASFQEMDRRPHLALEAMRKYLELTNYNSMDLENKEKIYRTAILAKLSGENHYAENLFTRLESDTTYLLEKESISNILKENILGKNWDKAIQFARKFLLYFPRNEVLHEYLILSLRGSSTTKKHELEKAYIDSCAIFSYNSNFAVRYGIYLQEQERMLEALAAFRRAFKIYLIHSKPFEEITQFNKNTSSIFNESERGEMLYLIRQTYNFLNRNHDSMAIARLTEIMEMGNLNDEVIAQSLRTYPRNRELLEYAVHYYKQKNNQEMAVYLEKQLKERDIEFEEKEFVFVIGPFVREKLE